MAREGFNADIIIRRRKPFVDKLFLAKSTISDPQNGCTTEMHMYIPTPTQRNPIPNVQLWIRNGAGKIQIRFKNPVELATTLRKLADTITSNYALDEFQHAEDMAEYC